MVVNRSTTGIMAEQRPGTLHNLKEMCSGWVNSIVESYIMPANDGTGDDEATGSKTIDTITVEEAPKETRTIATSTSHDRRQERKIDLTAVTMPEALTSKYETGRIIGRGDFALVLGCTMKETQSKCALKIYKPSVEQGLERKLINEISILSTLSHPNIVKLYEDFRSNDFMFEVVELLSELEHLKRRTKYSEDDARGMLYNLFSALEYLHEKNIIHRDVRPTSIRIRKHEDGTKSLILGHFYSAIVVTGPLEEAFGDPTDVEFLQYLAPEVLEGTWYGPKVDVWSAGVIGFTILSGDPPFYSPIFTPEEIAYLMVNDTVRFRHRFWKDISVDAQILISAMLTTETEIRFSATQVLDHSWMASSYSTDKEVTTSFTRLFRASGKKPNPLKNLVIKCV